MTTNDIIIKSDDLAQHIVDNNAPKPDAGPTAPGPKLGSDFVQAQEGTANTLEYRAGILQAEGKAREAAKLLASASMIRATMIEAKATAGYEPPRVAERQTMNDRAYGVGPEQPVPPPAMPMPTEQASAEELTKLAGALTQMRADPSLAKAVLHQVAAGPGTLDQLNEKLSAAGLDPNKAIDAVSSLLARYGAGVPITKLSPFAILLLATHAAHIARAGR